MIINSVLDTDFYKITMGQVVFFFFPDMPVKYKFILRDEVKFPDGFDTRLQEEVNHLATLGLTPQEYQWLSKHAYSHYLNWFDTYRFRPEEVHITFVNNKLSITIEGPWQRTIYWEVPLMAIISELYFEMTGIQLDLRDVFDQTRDKANKLEGIPFSDFGTRRRFSHYLHDNIISAVLHSNSKANFSGTSNPYFAMKYQIPAIGTYGHEAIMAMESIDRRSCDNMWLGYWKMLYGATYNTALSDTLTTNHFFNSVDPTFIHLLAGIRQDSGDPIEVGHQIIEKWKSLGIDPRLKKIIFSDNLNPDKIINIWHEFKNITNPRFGIGTNLTNAFGPTALNMVIKMVEANNKPVVKLSDDPGKACGNPKTIKQFREDFRI